MNLLFPFHGPFSWSPGPGPLLASPGSSLGLQGACDIADQPAICSSLRSGLIRTEWGLGEGCAL